MRDSIRIGSVLFLLALAGGLHAQDTTDHDPDRALSKLRDLLRNQPGHAGVFERYFKTLIERNAVDAEITTFTESSKKDPSDVATSIILGRLLLRAGKEERALEVLEAIPNKGEDVQQVLGDLYVKLAKFDAAARAFEAAMPAARTTEQKRVLLEKTGKAQLALNKKDAAVATWRKVAELDGGKFIHRLRFAELLAESGLVAEAAKEYQPLLAETESDPEQHCRVLRDLGRLQELQGELDAALATYDRIFALTARGKWIRKEVETRVVSIHRRTGKVNELLARLRTQLAEAPDDLALCELLANVQVETRDLDGAIATLGKVTPRYPKDVRLARRLAELHLEKQDIKSAIVEYQRILGEKPDELELYLELGQLFAKGDLFAEAKNQWEKALAKNLTDASLCTRIAAMYATWNRREDAARLYERAIELEPESMVRYTDLAEFLFAGDQRDAAVALLDRAITRAAGKARSLEALLGSLREHDLGERAMKVCEAILAVEPDNHEIRYGLADLLVGQGRVQDAIPLLWQVAEADAKADAYRTVAANALVNLAHRGNRVAELVADAEQRSSAGAAFVLGRSYSRTREFDKAIAAYRTAIERRNDDLEARKMLARLLAEEGDLTGALAAYETIDVIAPGERKRHFREVARLHLERYDLDAAVEVWQRAMRENPDNASVFVEVGKEFLAIQRVPEALEAFQQAARLRGKDVEVQMRLAAALAQAGKPEEAEKHLLEIANSALDPKDRAEARGRLFRLLGEQGTIDKRIEKLAATVAENPYEKEAPHLLADLYMRVGDFVLGLDMVEKSLQFQPRNKELLMRRAELLESLEEWEKARDAHEALLKFPDADRELHLAGMGQALFEMGRAEEGKAVLAKLRDQSRTTALFAKYELKDEAIEFWNRAIARSPGDLRAYVALAQQLHERDKAAEAIAVLERALNVKPFHRQALELAGKLYVTAGRRDDAVAAGMRLFGLRGEETEKTREEEQEEEQQRTNQRRWGGYSYWGRTFGQQRLEAAQTYFNERGLGGEWGKILVAEAKRRPTDIGLFNAVRSHYQWQERSAGKFVTFARGLLEKDFSKAPVPPGYTPRSYRQFLEEAVVQVWGQDASVAEARLAELAGDGRTPAELTERARAALALGRLDVAEADLRAALANQPAGADDPLALTLLVERLIEGKKLAEAVPFLERLAEYWRGPGAQWRAEREARMAETFKQQRKNILDQLPRRVRRKVTDEQLLALRRETITETWTKPNCWSFPEAAPGPQATAAKLIRTLRAAGDEAGLARAVGNAIAEAKTLGAKSALGVVLFQEGRKAEAAPLLREVLQQAEAIKRDPERVYFWAQFAPLVTAAADPLGQILKEQGEWLAAYAVLRDNGLADKAELILRGSGRSDELRQAFAAARTAAGEVLTRARQNAGADLKSVELDYRDAVIKLADFHLGQKDFAAAEQTYRESLELLPDDVEIRGVIAALQLRRGAHHEAIATHEETIQVKRRRKRAEAGETATPPTRLSPSLPGQTVRSGSSAGGGVMPGAYAPSYPGGYSGGYSSGRANRLEVADDYLAILRIHKDRDDHDGVFLAIKKIMQEDPATFRMMSWEVLENLRNQDLGKRKLPILRIVKDVVQNDDWLTLEYAKACREEGELKEARRTLEKLVARHTGTDDYYAQQAEKELDAIAEKLGEGSQGVATLQAQVEKEPDNVRHRQRLAERLKKDKDYRACLAHAQVVVAKAPYMSRAKEMVVEAAAACGEDAIALAMLKRLYEESADPNDKLRRGVSYANWLCAADRLDEACALIETIETKSGGSSEFSAGNWFMDKWRVTKALELYRADLEKNKNQSYRVQQLRPRIARLEASLGQEIDAVKRHLEAIDEAGSLADREQRWKELLHWFKGHPHPDRLRAQVDAAHAGRKTARDLLACAAAELATGDVPAAEQDLRRAIETSAKEVYLYPLLLGLRRLHDDFDGALATLEQMGRAYGGSETMRYSDGVSLSERERIKIERAAILELKGETAAVDELIESIADETKAQTFASVAAIWRQRGNLEKALQWTRRHAAKIVTRDKASLLNEARLLIDLRQFEDAKALLGQAFLMDRNDAETRDLLGKVHRRLGTIDQFVAELEAEHAKDIRDAGLRGALLQIYKEQRLPAKRRAIFTAMLPQDDLKKEALGGLIALAAEEGDEKTGLELRRQLLALKAGDEKKSLQREIAESLLRLGDVEGAAATMLLALEHDLDTANGCMELASWYLEHQLNGRARELFEKVVKIDRDNEQAMHQLAIAEWRERRFAEAIERYLEYLRWRRGRSFLDGDDRTLLLDSLAGLPAPAREALLAPPADGGAVAEQRAAVLHCARADFAAAAAHAQKALALDQDLLIARQALCAALRQLDRTTELIPAYEDLRARIEREYVANSDWEYFERAQDLQNRIGRLRWQLGDEAGAVKAWRDPPVRKTPYSNPFGYWRNDWGVRWLAEPWLAVGEPARALAAVESEFLLREQPPWRLYLNALERTGRGREVEAFAWQRLLDPMELYGVTAGEYGWIYEDGNYRQMSGMSEMLVDLYRRQGRLDELRTRAGELQRQPASRRQAEQVLDSLARLTGDWRTVAERKQKELDEKGDEVAASERYAAVKLWCDAQQYDRALALLQKLLDFDSEALREMPRDTMRYSRRSRVDRKSPFSFSFDGSGESYGWWYGWQELDEYRMRAAGLLLQAGQRDKALEVERDLLRNGTKKELRERKGNLAAHYAGSGVPQEAVRILREVLAAKDPDLKSEERAQLFGRLIAAHRTAGDRDGRRAAAQEQRLLIEQRIAEAPGPHALSIRSELATLLVDELDDPAAALEQIDGWLLRYDPRAAHAQSLRALALLRKGDHAAAIATLKELSVERRADGGGDDPPNETAMLGLALARSGKRDEGRTLLVQSLPKLAKKSLLREEVEAELGEKK